MLYRTFRNRNKMVGQAPGTMIHIGEQKSDQFTVQLIEYSDKGFFLERGTEDLAELAAAIETPTITWINIIGLHNVEMVESIGRAFGIHPLLLEDILNTEQRPKIEHYGQTLFLILKMLHWNEERGRVESEQMSLVLGKSFVLTFQEQERDIFDPLRGRLREGKGRIRKSGADYLAYAILDSVVDYYFLILERLGDQLEDIEEELIDSPSHSTLPQIYDIKREMLFLRKSVWPLREILSGLQRGDTEMFREETLIYLRDVYEHTIQVIDTVETFRDVAASMLDIYLSSVSNKMNEVMKVLTVIATIFIPLTFITSLYGMNFEHMPELGWRWSYPTVWVVMVLISAVMLWYFRRKDWL